MIDEKEDTSFYAQYVLCGYLGRGARGPIECDIAHASIDDSIRVDMVDNRKFWNFLFNPCTKQ